MIYGASLLRAQAKEVWLQQASQEVARITDTSLFLLSSFHAQLRGFAALFHGSEVVEENELLDALSIVEETEATIPCGQKTHPGYYVTSSRYD